MDQSSKKYNMPCRGDMPCHDAMIKTPLGVYPGMVSNGSDNLLPRNLVLRSGFTIQSFEKENGNCEDWIHAQDGQKTLHDVLFPWFCVSFSLRRTTSREVNRRR